MRKNADFQPAFTAYSRQPVRRVKGYTRVDMFFYVSAFMS